MLCEAYKDLRAAGVVDGKMSEDRITEEWFVKVQIRWKGSSLCLIPVCQKPDTRNAAPRGRPPTIDFCLRDQYCAKTYFGAECKLLDAGCRKHLREYLHRSRGIGRFLTCKYSAYTSAGAMVGYVRKGDAKVVARELADAIEKLSGNPQLEKTPSLSDFDDLYHTLHDRESGASPFTCFHLLFAFGCATHELFVACHYQRREGT